MQGRVRWNRWCRGVQSPGSSAAADWARRTTTRLVRVSVAGLLVGLAVAGSPAVAVARGSGEEAKSAEQIYVDMRKALRSLASLRVHRQGTNADHTTFAENLTANRAATHILDQSPGTNESID